MCHLFENTIANVNMENSESAFSIERRLKTVMNPSTGCNINYTIETQLNKERFHSSNNSRIEELGRNVDALIQEILCEEETDSSDIVTDSASIKEYPSSYFTNETTETTETNMVYNTTNNKQIGINFSIECESIKEKISLPETKSKPAFLKMLCNNSMNKCKEDIIVGSQNMKTTASMIAVNNIHFENSKSKQILVRDCDTIFEKDVDLEQSKNLVANLNELMEKNSVQFISADDSDTFIINLNSSIDTEQLSNFLDIGVKEVHFGTIQDIDNNVFQTFNLDNSLSSVNQSNANLTKETDIASVQHSKVYTCDKCKRIFKKKENFKSHLGTHDPSLSVHKCRICKKQFSWKSTLNKHIRKYHTPFVQTTYKCDMCEKVYKANWLLRNHVQRDHEKNYQFNCKVDGCNKSFFKQFDLTYHCRIQLGERPYECGSCKSRFSHASHRTRHERAGTCSSNHKSLICPLCKHVFRRSAAIATHMLHCKKEAGYGPHNSLYKEGIQQMCNEAKELLSDIDEVIKDAS